jgi:hypothetical protein
LISPPWFSPFVAAFDIVTRRIGATPPAHRTRAGQDHAHHLRHLVDQFNVLFGWRIHGRRAHGEHQARDRLGDQRRFVQREVVGGGQADQVDTQLFLEKHELAVHRPLERIRPHGALAQQHVQQLVVGPHLLHERLHRTANDAVVGGGAMARRAHDLAQRLSARSIRATASSSMSRNWR